MAVPYAALVVIAFLFNLAFGSRPLAQIAIDGSPIAEQLLWGMLITLSIGIPVWGAILVITYLASLRRTLVQLLGRIDTAGFNPVWIAVLAGIGEETLFRGALQPVIGLWWASIIFALLHFGSYQLRSINIQKVILVVLAFGASALLGLVFRKFGLVAAIVVHATWDLLGIMAIRRAAVAAGATA